jgi:hypothetical protein
MVFVLVLSVSVPAFGFNGLSTPPSGDNQAASVTQGIGPVRVTIDYSSPRVVRGKNDRKGKIWGELVPYGLSDLGANGCKTCPWRAGANENTLFTVSHDVKVQGEKLTAGKYGLFMIPGQDEWTIVFSRDTDAWGAFWYDPAHDVLRVKTKAGKSDYHEFLSYEFTEREPAKATVALKWEELQVPFTITVDNPDQLYVDMMRAELSSSVGFNWQNWQAAADFCAQKKINLQEGLKWAERSVSDPNWSGGQENFATLMTLSKLQAANGKDQEASKSFDKAINHPTATPVAIHQAARQLLTAGKKDQAVKLFQLNAKRYPNQWPVHVGLMRGYAAMGDAKKALEEAKLAVAQAPDEGNKKNLQTMIKQLEEGKTDIN